MSFPGGRDEMGHLDSSGDGAVWSVSCVISMPVGAMMESSEVGSAVIMLARSCRCQWEGMESVRDGGILV